MKIVRTQGQELLDSRGNPTVEATVFLANGMKARAMVPSGASTGKYEALELRDGDSQRYLGRGVLQAVQNVNDVIGPALLKHKTGNRVQIVGDDLFVTNMERVRKGIELDAANSVLIKINQIGTITEALGTIHLALEHGMTAIISHRSGETELPFESEFAVGTGVGQVKTGSVSRSERVAEYNQLMRIERSLGDRAVFAGFPFAHYVEAKTYHGVSPVG